MACDDVLDASEGRGVCRAVPVVVPPDTEDNRFFASATAPVAEGLGAARVVVAGADAVEVEDFEVAVAAGFDGLVPVTETGFLAAAVVAAVVLLVFGLAGDGAALAAAVEVRRAAPVAEEVAARFFSSSDTDG